MVRSVLARRLRAARLGTVGELVNCCNSRGRGWWRGVPRVGALAASAIVSWRLSHEHVSQVIRKLIETLFGDGKQHGTTIRQVKLRGQAKVNDVFTIAMLVVNLRRLPKLFALSTAMAGSG